MNDFAKQYLDANKITIALNCIKYSLWYHASISATIEKSYQNAPYNGIIIDKKIFYDTIIKILEDMTTKNGFTKIVNNERKTIVYPVCRNTKEYIKMFMESEKAIDEMTDFIKNIL